MTPNDKVSRRLGEEKPIKDEQTPPAEAFGSTAGLGGWARRAALWVTGRDILKPPLPTLPQGMQWTIVGPPEARWEMTLSSDSHLTFSLPTGPNAVHRLAQWFALGIHWRMLPPNVEVSGSAGTPAMSAPLPGSADGGTR